MRCSIVLVLTVLCAAVVVAEEKPSPQQEAMKKLDFLIGEWSGEGWMQRGPQRDTFTSHETVAFRAGGFAILVEGAHKSPDASEFGAIGIITFDETSGSYKFHSQSSEGKGGDSEMKLIGDRVVQWSPAPVVRYTLDFTKGGRWIETGEYSRDGKEWKKFFEMTLERVK